MAGPKTCETTISRLRDRSAGTAASLVVLHGQELGRKFELGAATLIGRSPRCEIQVDQNAVSRQHARIDLVKGKAILVDAGSTNGTYVNDEKLAGVRKLRNGDLIKIGRTVFKYLAGGNIENRYHEELYRLTTTDGLTQIFNRRYFRDVLDREVSRCNRYGRSLSLALFDIDHFKRVNDEHGHLAGDHVLKSLANLLKSKIRREDILARYGGEEFALVLPEIKLKGALLTAERLRALVEKLRVEFEEEPIPISVSAGVATLGGTDDGAQELVRAADARLYEAKEAGRNCVRG